MRGVFDWGGRPNGMVQLLVVADYLFVARGKVAGEGIEWCAAAPERPNNENDIIQCRFFRLPVDTIFFVILQAYIIGL